MDYLETKEIETYFLKSPPEVDKLTEDEDIDGET